MHVIGFFLPDPKQLIHRRFPIGAPEGHQREFLLQIIAVHHTEQLDGVGRGAVLPMGTYRQGIIAEPVVKDGPTGLLVNFIRIAHGVCSSVSSPDPGLVRAS